MEGNTESRQFCCTAFGGWSTNLRRPIRRKGRNQSRSGYPRFPALESFFMSLLWVLIGFFWILFFVPIGPYDFFRSRFQRIYWRKRLMWKLKLLFQFILSVNTKNTWPLSFCKNCEWTPTSVVYSYCQDVMKKAHV